MSGRSDYAFEKGTNRYLTIGGSNGITKNHSELFIHSVDVSERNNDTGFCCMAMGVPVYADYYRLHGYQILLLIYCQFNKKGLI